MSVVPDSSLREQLVEALKTLKVQRVEGFSAMWENESRTVRESVVASFCETSAREVDAIMPIFSAGLAAALADEREKIAKAIEAQRSLRRPRQLPPGLAFATGMDVAAEIARSAGAEPKEQQT